MLSVDILKKALPSKYKNKVNDELLNQINQTLSDPDLYDTYKENFISYLDVLNDGKYKIQDYMNAVKYCTHKLMGNTNTDAYIKTFPQRYQTMIDKGYTSKEMSSHISIYNKSQLVNKIMEQSLIPSWVLNQDLYQKAINVQADLMMNAQSEKVRSDSANSLLIHLKPPEVKKVELDIGLKANSEIEELKLTLAELASQQQRMIKAGISTATDVAEQKLIRVIDYEENS